jgi:hypothetical protein
MCHEEGRFAANDALQSERAEGGATAPQNRNSDADPTTSRTTPSPSPHRPRRPWHPIPTDWIPRCHEMETFPPGFKVNVFDGVLMRYFEVPSEWIVPTVGAVRYVEHFNEAGPYTQFRFQLCHNFVNGRCHRGFHCTYVHARQLPPAHQIHVQGVDTYERLPPGIMLSVYMPGSAGSPQTIPSEFIFRTRGSERIYADLLNAIHVVFQRPQHCAHFLFKKVCNRGADCAFIHALVSPTSSGQPPL